MDWDDLRFFLELARQKRLVHAGHKLGVDHSTVARRVEQLEAALGCRLFESTAQGYLLTESGQRLLGHAEGIENAVALLHDEAADQNVLVSGVVRIGTPEGFGTAFLAPRLGPLLDLHPELDIELLSLPRFPSLSAREADIIVTLDPPQHGRYIAARLTDFTYGVFASKDYLQRHGPVRSSAELASHRFTGYIDDLLLSPQLRYLDQIEPRPTVRIATSGMLAQLAAIREGLGIGVLAYYLARDAGLVQLLPETATWTRTFWLATHADWYRLRRIRAVWDFLRRIVDADSAFFAAAERMDADAGKATPVS